MSDRFQFTVYGRPVPQGSMRSFKHPKTGKVITTSDNKALKPWRQQVSLCAIEAFSGFIFEREVPVNVVVDFFLAKPKSAKKRTHPTVKPDVDKLVRAIFDALKGVAYFDDAQVCSVIAVKNYEAPERTLITVESRG